MAQVRYADVVIVGAGPGGSTAAAHLADAGRDVVVLDKDHFPREKVCGDGLTPRAVKQLVALGLRDEAEGRVAGWARSTGLRVHGGGHVIELPWPELTDFPGHSLTCVRSTFDHTLAQHAVKRGAQVQEGAEVTGPVWSTRRPDRVAGVRWKDEEGNEGEVRAPVVLAADGASSRFAVALDLHRRDDRPMAVAVRTYYRSDRRDDVWLSSFLELRHGDDLLPGYGWIFPMADGTVNVGAGLPDSSRHFRQVNYRRLLQRWVEGLPDHWGLSDAIRDGRIRSGPLPMGFSRKPHAHRGVLLIGDAGGHINPMNGEGIAYAMESAQLAAETADRALETRRTDTLRMYAVELDRRWGGYYTLGRLFLELIGHPEIMRVCTEYGLPRRRLMAFVMKLLANLTDQRPGDAMDVVINTASRIAPAA
ncbi:MAG: geranylgeranyl reductase family protein [Actinobacteria bacterium]|nr:geranylgeranyl reductase family protein [Actinomycetota bacterium]